MSEVDAASAIAASGGAASAKASGAFASAKAMALFTFLGGAFMFILTMAFQPPKSVKEVVLAFTSLIICGFCGSSFMIFYFGWNIPAGFDGDSIRFGLAMPCAALGWLIIKGWFNYAAQNQDKTLVDLVKQLIALRKDS